MATQSETREDVARQRDAFVERLLQAAAGTFEIFSVYLGHKLGFYRALAAHGPLNARGLAERTGTNERYAREWLEQQATIGVLEVAERSTDRSLAFRLLPGHAEVLVDTESLSYLAPLAQLLAGAVKPLDRVLAAYRTGGGVPYGAYGADVREGQAAINRAPLLHQLGAEWIPVMPDVDARLRSQPAARVADIGCGAGWASIGIARSYPQALVDGFDFDAPSVALARENAREYGVAERVRFHVRDAADPELKGRYDLVLAFECIHDMSDPVGALRVMRQLAAENGCVLVADEKVAEEFTPGGEGLDWMMYGWSILHCLPAGMADQPSAATGTVMRPRLLGEYARQAGYRDVEVLPIDTDFFRFYRLHP